MTSRAILNGWPLAAGQFIPTPAVPAAPTVTLTAGNGQVSIAWADGAAYPAVTAHKLYAGASSGSLALVGTITTASPYIDTGLTNGVTRYYALSAVNSVGEGSLSAVQSATPQAVTALPSGMIMNFRADAITGAADNSTFAAWNDPLTGTTGTLIKGTPKYRTAGFNGKPTVRFDGNSGISIGKPAALVNAIAAGAVTEVVVIANTAAGSGDGYLGPFGNGDYNSHWFYANGVHMGVPGLLPNSVITGLTVIVGQYALGDPTTTTGRCYINGTSISASGGLGGSTVNGWGIGDADGPAQQIGGRPYVGDILAVQAWNKRLTHAEVINVVRHWFETVGLPLPWASMARFPVFVGDSITEFVGASAFEYTMPTQVATALSLGFGQFSNLGRSGAQISDCQSIVNVELAGLSSALGIPIAVVYNEWTNSAGGAPPTSQINQTKALLDSIKTIDPTAKTLFWTPVDVGVAGSPITESASEPGRQAFISALTSPKYASIDVVANVHLNTHVGATGSVVASDRDTWWFDEKHPRGNATATNGYKEMANVIAPALAPILTS